MPVIDSFLNGVASNNNNILLHQLVVKKLMNRDLVQFFEDWTPEYIGRWFRVEWILVLIGKFSLF